MAFEQSGMNNAGYPTYERKRKKETVQKKPKTMTRRGFLRGAASSAMTAGALGGVVGTAFLKESEDREEAMSESEMESVEVLPSSESFERERLGWQRWWELRYDQVLFVDESGAPVGQVVDFENFIVQRTRTGADGQPEEFDYLLAPGGLDDSGMLAGNIAGEWLRYVEARHAREYDVSTDEISQRNVTQEFESAVSRADDEPELAQSILDAVNGGNGIETMVDVVQYYGMNPEKMVRGDRQERTRSEYLEQEIEFHNRVPQLVQDELRGFVVGLAAQESRFNAGLPKNSVTAEGVMQLKDDVREENGYDPERRLSFREEVDVAGKHFSNIYTRVRHWMQNEIVPQEGGGTVRRERPETYERLRALFGEGQEGEQLWQKHFLVPCMINAYNAGSWTIGACLHALVDAYTDEELREMAGEPVGYDLFRAFTHFAKDCDVNQYTQQYGPDAQAYFFSIAGVTEALKT